MSIDYFEQEISGSSGSKDYFQDEIEGKSKGGMLKNIDNALGFSKAGGQINDMVRTIGTDIIRQPTQLLEGIIGRDIPVEKLGFNPVSYPKSQREVLGGTLKAAAFGLGPVSGGAVYMGGETIGKGGSPQEIAKDTAIGAAGGKLFSKTLGMLHGEPLLNLSPIKNKILSTKFGKYIASKVEGMNINKATQLEDEATQIYREVLKPLKGDLNRVEVIGGKNIDHFYNLAAKEQLPISQVDNKLNTLDAVELVDRKISMNASNLDDLLAQDKRNKFDLNAVRQQALKNIDRREISADEYFTMKKDINDYINKEQARHGRYLNAQQMNDFKQGMWKIGYNQMKPTAKRSARQLGSVARQEIEKSFYGDDTVRILNQEMADYLTLKDLLENAHGRVVSGGALGQHVYGTLGAIAGSKIPIAGPLAGNIIGRNISKAMIAPERMTKIAAQKMAQAERLNPKTHVPELMGSFNPIKEGAKGLPSQTKFLPPAQPEYLRAREVMDNPPNVIHQGTDIPQNPVINIPENLTPEVRAAKSANIKADLEKFKQSGEVAKIRQKASELRTKNLESQLNPILKKLQEEKGQVFSGGEKLPNKLDNYITRKIDDDGIVITGKAKDVSATIYPVPDEKGAIYLDWIESHHKGAGQELVQYLQQKYKKIYLTAKTESGKRLAEKSGFKMTTPAETRKGVVSFNKHGQFEWSSIKPVLDRSGKEVNIGDEIVSTVDGAKRSGIVRSLKGNQAVIYNKNEKRNYTVNLNVADKLGIIGPMMLPGALIAGGAIAGNAINPVKAEAALPSDEEAIMAIIGEVGPYGKEGMQWVASAIRNRNNGVKGIYGGKNPNVINKKYTKQQYEDAKRAWEESKDNDFTSGAKFWFSDADLKQKNVQNIIDKENLEFIAKKGGNNFYRKRGKK